MRDAPANRLGEARSAKTGMETLKGSVKRRQRLAFLSPGSREYNQSRCGLTGLRRRMEREEHALESQKRMARPVTRGFGEIDV